MKDNKDEKPYAWKNQPILSKIAFIVAVVALIVNLCK